MRRPRLELPGIPLHITHRGVKRCATFIDDEDFASYLQALDACARGQGIALHGDVLMTHHVHLLVSAEAGGAALCPGLQCAVQAHGPTVGRPLQVLPGRQ